MRPLEITLLAINAVCLAGPFLRVSTSSVWRFIALLSFAAVVLQVGIEGFRWQMVPAYGGVAVSFLIIWPWPWAVVNVLLGCSGLCLLTASAVLGGVVSPVFTFPPLTGPFPVGTTTRYLVDTNRREVHGHGSPANRELMVQIWYPAEASRAQPIAHYVTPSMVGRRDRQLALVQTRSISDAPVSRTGGPFPIVFFSPSIGGDRYQNTFQTEELASHGFVVIGIDHPYSCGKIVFPDGRCVRLSIEYLNTSSETMLRESTRRLEEDLAVRSGDVSFLADSVARWNHDDPLRQFTGRLNPDALGIIGHSYGGAVAADVCRRDPRFLAGMNLDGWMFGKAEEFGIETPFFFVIDDEPVPNQADLNSPDPAQRCTFRRIKQGFDDIYNSLRAHGGYYLSLKGAAHFTYSDKALYSNIRRFADAGSVDVRFAHAVLNKYTVAFFAEYLYGKSQRLLEEPNDRYPVTFRTYGQQHKMLSTLRSTR